VLSTSVISLDVSASFKATGYGSWVGGGIARDPKCLNVRSLFLVAASAPTAPSPVSSPMDPAQAGHSGQMHTIRARMDAMPSQFHP
jgi:hypothetical protein